MVIQLVLQIALLLWLTQASSALAASLAKPGCPDKCGNITIPYPFGIGANCFVASNESRYSFEIICNKSFTPPKPFITSTNLEVLEISLTEGTVRVNNPVITFNCDNRVNHQVVDLNPTPFFFSDTYTRFTAMGCDNLALIDYGGMAIGGVSNCNVTAREKRCFGINCCQTTIPPSLDFFNASFRSIDSNNDNKGCKYAFMVDQDWFTNLTDPYAVREMKVVPAVLRWGTYEVCHSFIGYKSSSSLCGTNASCFNRTYGGSSLCQCHHGYEGNPYLLHGCQGKVLQYLSLSSSPRTANTDNHLSVLNFRINYTDLSWIEMMNDVRGRKKWMREDFREVKIGKKMCVDKYVHNLSPGSYKCHCPPGYAGGYSCYELKVIEPKQNRKVIIILGDSFLLSFVGAGIGLVILFLIGTWWMIKLVKRRRKIKLQQKFFKRNGGLLLQQQLSSGEGNADKTKLFSSKELEIATDNFNENRILGQGGQGTVYKGMLIDGKIVAVKKSKIVDEGQLEQFINEVVILSQIIHRNIVKLHECCLETEVPLLVYEFIPNGTLFQYIHDQNEEFPLSWDIRVRIAIEVAGALSYLHSAASIPIYHRDIKSANILLDDKYRAKVSDFRTSRSIAGDQTHLTTKVQGTFGYLDPEYFQSSQFTEKSDVYSFGVVLVELLTGQKAISSARSEEWRSLAAYFILMMKENRLFDILDAQVVKEGGKEEIMRVANLAKRCLNLNGRKRPTMKEVVTELEGIRMPYGASTVQQNYEEVEFTVVDLTGPWDAASTSTSFYKDSSVSSSSDVQYLL
ncbi:wall-associated receptor kinase-like 3 [Cornus florida]|uniref:wall-associated receptor kinase-like 3 n=1 Tax=Cornus florida TaxID=4283 RepID=UPI002897C34E|nr:wall-associated receptor kinase-like 3 [Cornus florida]